jgi:hypothetical protein
VRQIIPSWFTYGTAWRYDSYFTLSFMQAGFIVAAGGLLPQLLAFYEMSHASVWRAPRMPLGMCEANRMPPRSRAIRWGVNHCLVFV